MGQDVDCVCVHVDCPGGTSGKEPPPGSRETQERCIQFLGREGPWRRAWQPTPGFLPSVFIRYVCMCIYIQCVFVYIHNGILFSHKKNGNLPLAWMDVGGIMLSEVTQKRISIV